MSQPILGGYTLPYPSQYQDAVVPLVSSYMGISTELKRDIRAGSDYMVVASMSWEDLTRAELSAITTAWNALLFAAPKSLMFMDVLGATYYAELHPDQPNLAVSSYHGIRPGNTNQYEVLHNTGVRLKLHPHSWWAVSNIDPGKILLQSTDVVATTTYSGTTRTVWSAFMRTRIPTGDVVHILFGHLDSFQEVRVRGQLERPDLRWEANNVALTGIFPPTSEWAGLHHSICIVCDGTNAHLYVNGVFQVSVGGGSTPLESGDTLWRGANVADYMLLYRGTPLTSTQVMALHANTIWRE